MNRSRKLAIVTGLVLALVAAILAATKLPRLLAWQKLDRNYAENFPAPSSLAPSQQSAPKGAQDSLEKVERGFGFIPILMGVMAEAPPLLDAYLALYDQFGRTGLAPTARQIVLLAASYENECDYCMAAHSTGAAMGGVPAEVVDALRQGEPLPNAELEALRRFVAAVVRERGRPPEGEIERFLASGYTKTNILEVVLGVGLKTLSNYTNHIAATPLDAAFAPQQWRKAS